MLEREKTRTKSQDTQGEANPKNNMEVPRLFTLSQAWAQYSVLLYIQPYSITPSLVF